MGYCAASRRGAGTARATTLHSMNRRLLEVVQGDLSQETVPTQLRLEGPAKPLASILQHSQNKQGLKARYRFWHCSDIATLGFLSRSLRVSRCAQVYCSTRCRRPAMAGLTTSRLQGFCCSAQCCVPFGGCRVGRSCTLGANSFNSMKFGGDRELGCFAHLPSRRVRSLTGTARSAMGKQENSPVVVDGMRCAAVRGYGREVWQV